MGKYNSKNDIALRFQEIRKHFFGDVHGGMKKCAECVGFSLSVWSDFEAGRRNLTAENAWKVHEAFGVELQWLIRGEGEMLHGQEQNASPAEAGAGSAEGKNAPVGTTARDLDSLHAIRAALLEQVATIDKMLGDG